GYRFDTRTALVACNVGGILFAPFGLHSANLATVTGMMCAGPEAHPVRRSRYIAGISAGVFYLVAGLFAPAIVMAMSMISGGALALISGLVLLPALSTALTTLLRRTGRQSAGRHTAGLEAGIVALVVTASDLTVAGITAPCWGITAGILVYLLLTGRPTQPPVSKPSPAPEESAPAQAPYASSTVDSVGRKTS
ncbi:MAG TPA: benzoate/H(+) symporter BenE family transporter, partial [Enteractinococcus sp.]